MNTITLPPRTAGRAAPALPPGTRCLTVIGANGAGKSRFANRLSADLDGQAWQVSALHAIYGPRRGPGAAQPGPVDAAYLKRLQTAPMMRTDLESEFDRMMALLLNEEMGALLSQKYDSEAHSTVWEPTHLERMARLWHDLFPDNRMLVEKGTVLFANNSSAESVAPARLSDGEKAIIYYLGVALLAPRDAVMVVDNPTIFLHPSMTRRIWEKIEEVRGRGRMVYVTHDLDFASDRAGAGGTAIVWVRRYDADEALWDYEILPPGAGLSDEAVLALMGSRKPVMFIEGDGVHSIDAKLYPLVFNEYTVKSLGSCDKVIEATRSFNDLNQLHNLDSVGIVDRDRRNAREVDYLRRRRILVPDVAEIENLFMLPDVIRAVAAHYNRDPEKAFTRTAKNVMRLFADQLHDQALQHTRHNVKVTVEHTVDRRFDDVGQLEKHLLALVREIRPRRIYDAACADFERMVCEQDYMGVLRVFNMKRMISDSGVASQCGVRGDKDGYIAAVLSILRHGGRHAETIKTAIKRAFCLDVPEPAPVCDYDDEDDHPTTYTEAPNDTPTRASNRKQKRQHANARRDARPNSRHGR